MEKKINKYIDINVSRVLLGLYCCVFIVVAMERHIKHKYIIHLIFNIAKVIVIYFVP